MTPSTIRDEINAFRKFNRFYTKQIGLLNQGLVHSRFSLTQARILFELNHAEKTTASDLIEQLDIDRGYLSRILKSFEKEGLIRATRSQEDSRQRMLTLTSSGRKTFSVLNQRSTNEAKALLQALSTEDRQRLLNAMQAIESILGANLAARGSITLRTHKPGDIGWVTHRHGALYKEEYGWSDAFEALVAEILVNFVQKHDPKRERLWMAEQDGQKVGSVMIVDAGNGVSQLRLLLVEPYARGQGLGKRLIEKCMDFSRRTGYRRMKLWTQSNLTAARKLYAALGWKLVDQKANHSFGKDLVSEFWELEL